MSTISRTAVSYLLGVGFMVSAVCNGTASTMSAADMPPESATLSVILQHAEDDRLTTENILGIGGNAHRPCAGASARWRSAEDDALDGTAFGMAVSQSDTIAPPIERDLCADALATRQYWCDRAAGPNGTHQDLMNCMAWDLVASFLCSWYPGLGLAAGSPAFLRAIPPQWVIEHRAAGGAAGPVDGP